MGANYSGIPLSLALAEVGFPTTIFDTSSEKISSLNRRESPITDVSSENVKRMIECGKLKASNDPDVLSAGNVIIICLPTAGKKTREPDHQQVLEAAEAIASRMAPGTLVILESTTLPCFTREQLIPRLANGKLQEGEDFFVAVAPERADPGNKNFTLANVPRVIGANSKSSAIVAKELYSHVTSAVVSVSNTDTAEMAKLLESAFRAVNYAVANEMVTMCQTLGVDTCEVIQAAATKPFGFMAFSPGPGIGGQTTHSERGYVSSSRSPMPASRLLDLADNVSARMPELVVDRVRDALNDRGQPVRGTKVLVVGVTYKPNISDMADSPALDIIEMLRARGAFVSYSDPYVYELSPASTKGAIGSPVRRVELEKARAFDCVLIVTDHACVDLENLVNEAPLIVDARNATSRFRTAHRDKIYTL